jgi:hypothetical protein
MRVKRLVILLSFIVLAVASGLFIFWAMGTSWFWGFQISAYEKQDRINPQNRASSCLREVPAFVSGARCPTT